MANRFPLIFNSGAGQIQELASGDNLDLTSSNLVNAGILFTSSGSVTAPSLQIGSGTTYNPGIYSPGTDQLAISTNGTGQVFVDANGNVGIGNSTPVNSISTSTVSIGGPTTGGGQIEFKYNGSGKQYIFNSNTDLTFFNNNGATIFSNGSFERMRLTSAGLLGLGTSAPRSLLNIANNATTGTILTVENTSTSLSASQYIGRIQFYGNDISSNSAGVRASIDAAAADAGGGTDIVFSNSKFLDSTLYERLRIDQEGRVGIGTTSPGSALEINAAAATSPFIAKINTAEAARIDSSGRLLVGTSSAAGVDNTTLPAILVSSASSAAVGRGIQCVHYGGTTDSASSFIGLRRSRGTAADTYTSVQNGDALGAHLFYGSDGSGWAQAASIAAYVDGTPGANDMPGRLVFSTTADGSPSPTERLRITSAGVLQVADASNITVGTTTGTKIGTATTQKLGFYNATPVVQPTAVADATTVVDVITQLNALLAKLRTLGIIAT